METPSGGTVTRDRQHPAVPAVQPLGRRLQQQVPQHRRSRRPAPARAPASPTPTNGTVDIGASDAYLSPTEVTANPDLKNIPLAISAQIIAYNVPGVTAHLKLTGKVLSEIYQGTDHHVERLADHQPQPGRHAAEHPDRDPAPLGLQR